MGLWVQSYVNESDVGGHANLKSHRASRTLTGSCALYFLPLQRHTTGAKIW
jgi:hypothetical protein